MNKQTQIRIALVLVGLLLMLSPFFKQEVHFKSEIGTIVLGSSIFMFALLRNKYVRVGVLIFALFAFSYGYFA